MGKRLTVADASRELDVSKDTIRRWAKLGLIRCSRDASNNRLFDLDDIRQAKLQHEAASGTRRPPRFEVFHDEPTPYTSLELFAGAGGTALGMHNAGLQHLMLNEFDKYACQTLRHNMPEWNVVEGDVHEVSFAEYRGRVDFLQGGVPCQAFSYAGAKRGFEDTRGTLFFEFARAISECRPKVIGMENVRGLLTHDHGRTIQTMVRSLNELGYRVALKVLRAQFLDVAQKRERLVIIGVRDDLDLPILFPRQDSPLLSLWDAIGDCPESEGATYPEAKREILAKVPAGGYWKDLSEEDQRRYLKGSYDLPGGKTGMARRLSWDEPSLTLTCSPAQKQTERCHPEQTRPLTVREYARIQSFPDDWEFCGSLAAKYRQIGNAVPVNLAFHIGEAVVAMLSGERREKFVEVDPVDIDALTTAQLKERALIVQR